MKIKLESNDALAAVEKIKKSEEIDRQLREIQTKAKMVEKFNYSLYSSPPTKDGLIIRIHTECGERSSDAE